MGTIAPIGQQPAAPTSRLIRIGIPAPLAWGYLAVLLFMIGDGIETGYIATFLGEQPGASRGTAETAIAVYGAAVAIGSWLSGTLSTMYGPRAVMRAGAAIWIVFEVLFLTIGLTSGPAGMIVLYSIRGLGYPLFAYGFLVWIVAATPSGRLSPALGWFWFVFVAGLPTLGSLIASVSIPVIGAYQTLWLSLGLVIIGGAIGSFAVRERTGLSALSTTASAKNLLDGITICWREPKIAIGLGVKIVNAAAMFGFFVFLPFFFEGLGFSSSRWLLLNTLIFVANLIGNLVIGFLAHRLGWRRTVTYVGALGCAIATLLMYFVPLMAGNNFPVAIICGSLYGFALAGFVPLSALMPAMAPSGDTGSALAMLNLGSGLAAFVGPAIVAVFRPLVGIAGVVWIFAALYIAAAVASRWLTTSADPEIARKSAA
ncbi:MFS transporter [Mycolicibacterium wolinskyi]|uniref:MFS transporter n=1 Tax=Mycolicibacterium wolinskyi TaxID=59750 RepID=UPI003917A1C7